jgi:hypothetical protein
MTEINRSLRICVFVGFTVLQLIGETDGTIGNGKAASTLEVLLSKTSNHRQETPCCRRSSEIAQ